MDRRRQRRKTKCGECGTRGEEKFVV